jgi:thioredoxin reductase (NADPH)
VPVNARAVDLLVVGAGPCGLAVGAAARQQGLTCTLLEAGTVAESILRYPVHTTFFSGAEKLEIAGLPFTISGDKPTRREAIRYFRGVARYFALDVRPYERVVGVASVGDGFEARTRGPGGEERLHRGRALVLATGYFDRPNRLDVRGADLPKVSYYFTEPFPYYDQDVLVIGGGNSAADAALTCWREGARVTLAHLEAALDGGIKPWVRPDIENRIAEGSIPALWRHRVTEIGWRAVELEDLETGVRRTLRNDWVLAMIGYDPDTTLARSLGVHVDPGSGAPVHDEETLETNVPGVYIAGVLASGRQANRIFIENGKLHGPRIATAFAHARGAR